MRLRHAPIWFALPLALLAGCGAATATSPAATSPVASHAATEASASPAAEATAGLTMAEVSQHADEASCWAVVSGNVYDLTKWIEKHPGGHDKILALCGKDATAAFSQQHGTQPEPTEMLATFLLGKLT